MNYRVVVDTNLIISAFVWGGVPLRLFDQVVSLQIPLLTSQSMVDELDTTLRKSKFEGRLEVRKLTVENILPRYTAVTELVNPASIPAGIVRDRKDQMIVAAAVGGNASHLISGDKDLTTLAVYQEIVILTAAQFLAILNPPVERAPDATADQSSKE